MMQNCCLCPRLCGTDRTSRSGFCGGGSMPRVARAALHFWEEPCISGNRGSGTVFFSGCPLGCCFCQNHIISAQKIGVEIPIRRLADIFLELQEQGAHNINLVNPTHFQPAILEALRLIHPALSIPVVWNSSGYERMEILREMNGFVDIYLTDIKFFDTFRSERYANAADYFQYASEATKEMFKQTGACQFDADGILQKGLIIRHLVMPKGREDSKKILDWIVTCFSPEEIRISLMSQFSPLYRSAEFPEINRRVSTFEYNDVLTHTQKIGLNGYMQERSSANPDFTPQFDLTGVLP